MIDPTELRELEAAATPGPWVRYFGGQCCRADCITSEHEATRGIGVHDADALPYDAALIAAMRNALPDLLATAEAVERVRALVAEAESSIRGVMFDGSPFPAQVSTDALTAALSEGGA